MSETKRALILVSKGDHHTLAQAAFSEAAIEIRDDALAAGSLIGRVTNADDQAAAVAAQKRLAEVRLAVKKAHESAKRPVIDYGRSLDSMLRDFVSDVEQEERRLATLIGDFQALEYKKRLAAEQAENERLAALEREKAKAMAEATTIEEVDKVSEEFSERARAEAVPVAPPPRVAGQVIKPDWEITVTDIHALYRHHPNCVKLEALVSEIKDMIKAGAEKIHGVTFKPIIKSQVRPGKQPAAIDV